jgi:hypothetical protein
VLKYLAARMLSLVNFVLSHELELEAPLRD